MRKEIFHLSDVIYKDLQEMLNIDFLLLFELKMLVVVRCEALPFVPLVLNQRIDNLFNQILKLVNEPIPVVITHRDPALSVPIIFSPYRFK